MDIQRLFKIILNNVKIQHVKMDIIIQKLYMEIVLKLAVMKNINIQLIHKKFVQLTLVKVNLLMNKDYI